MILICALILSITTNLYAADFGKVVAEMKNKADQKRLSLVGDKPTPLHVHNLSGDLSSSSPSSSPIITPTPAVLFTALDKRLVKTAHGLQQFLTKLKESQSQFCCALDAWRNNEQLPEHALHHSTIKLEMAQDLMRDMSGKSKNSAQLDQIRRTAQSIELLTGNKKIEDGTPEAKRVVSRKVSFDPKASGQVTLEGTELEQYNAVCALLNNQKLDVEKVVVNIGTDLDGVFVLLNAVKLKKDEQKYLDAIKTRAADIAHLAEVRG